MKRSHRQVLVAVLAGALVVLPGPLAAEAGTCAVAYETVQLKTLHVVLKVEKKVYRVGNVVPVQAEVTRPAHEDPANQRQPIDPPVSQPAANVYVGLGLLVGRTYLFGIGTTDGEGKTTIRVPLPEYVPAGRVFARSLAWNKLVETTCLIVEEQGYTEEKNFFTIKK